MDLPLFERILGKRMIKKIDRRIISLCGLTALVIVLMVSGAVLIYQELPEYGTFSPNRNEEQFIHDLWMGTIVEQEFKCVADCEFITLEFSDHDTTIGGKTHFLVKQTEDGQIVCNIEIDNSEIHFLKPVKLYLDGGGVKDKSYIVTISSLEAPEGAALGLFGYIPDNGEEVCSVNGEKSEYAVGVGQHTDTESYQIHFWLVILILVIMLFACIFFTEFRQKKTEELFLCIAIPIGIIFTSFLNVNIVHDGVTHLTNVYKYSNILTGKAGQDSLGYVYLSPDEAALRQQTDNFYVLLKSMGDKPDRSGSRVPYYDARPTNNDSILEYFPGVIGVTLGRLLNFSAMNSLLMAKCLCLAFYIIICYWAIKITPVLKEGFVVASTLPMNLYQAAGITYDAVTTPVAYLVFAMVLKGRQEQLSKQEWIVLFGASIILGACKGGCYIPVLLLLIFIQGGINGGKKAKIKRCLISWILAGGTLLITYSSGFHNFFFEYENEISVQVPQTLQADGSVLETVQVIEPKYSMRYLFTDPVDFIKMFIRTMFDRSEYYLGSMVGNRMAWTDREADWTIIILFFILLVLSCAWKEENIKNIKAYERIMAGILLVCELIGFHVIMLVETQRGAVTILGVQGRYFLPLIPIAMFTLFTKERKKTHSAGKWDFNLLCLAQIMYVFDLIKIIYEIE